MTRFLSVLDDARWISLVLSVSRHFYGLVHDFGALYHRFCAYARAHPIPSATHVCGYLALVTSICLLPALGFSGLGPVAGSVAAGWQSALGSVAAGGLFSFLQSAAMGGTAAGLFTGIGIFGAVAFVGPTLLYTKEIGKGAGAIAGQIMQLIRNTRDRMRAVTKVVGEGTKSAWSWVGGLFSGQNNRTE